MSFISQAFAVVPTTKPEQATAYMWQNTNKINQARVKKIHKQSNKLQI